MDFVRRWRARRDKSQGRSLDPDERGRKKRKHTKVSLRKNLQKNKGQKSMPPIAENSNEADDQEYNSYQEWNIDAEPQTQR